MRRPDRGHSRAGPRGQRAGGRSELRPRRPDAAQRGLRVPGRRRPGPAAGHEGRERQGGTDNGRSRRGGGRARRQRRPPVHGHHRLVGRRPQGPEPLPLQRAGARPRVGRELPRDAAVPHRQLRPVHARERHARRRRPVARAGGALLPDAGRQDRHQGGHDHGGGRGRCGPRADERVRAGADEQREPPGRPQRGEQRRGPLAVAGVLGAREGRRVHAAPPIRRPHPRAAVLGPRGGHQGPLLAAAPPRDRRAHAELLAERQRRRTARDRDHPRPPGRHLGERRPRRQSPGPQHVLPRHAGARLPDERRCPPGPLRSGRERARRRPAGGREPRGDAAEPVVSHDVPHLDPPRHPRRVHDHDARAPDVRLPRLGRGQRRQRRLRGVHRGEPGREAVLQRGPSSRQTRRKPVPPATAAPPAGASTTSPSTGATARSSGSGRCTATTTASTPRWP